MTYLIALIIGLALTASILFMYSSSLNERQFVISNNVIQIENRFLVLKKGYQQFNTYQGQILDSINWETQINNYVVIPQTRNGFTYSFGNSAGGDYFCLSKNGTTSGDNLKIEELIEFTNNNNRAYIANTCGETSSVAVSAGDDVAVSFYVGGL